MHELKLQDNAEMSDDWIAYLSIALILLIKFFYHTHAHFILFTNYSNKHLFYGNLRQEFSCEFIIFHVVLKATLAKLKL